MNGGPSSPSFSARLRLQLSAAWQTGRDSSEDRDAKLPVRVRGPVPPWCLATTAAPTALSELCSTSGINCFTVKSRRRHWERSIPVCVGVECSCFTSDWPAISDWTAGCAPPLMDVSICRFLISSCQRCPAADRLGQISAPWPPSSPSGGSYSTTAGTA